MTPSELRPQTTEPWISWHSASQRWLVRIRLRGAAAHVGYASTLPAAVQLRNAWCQQHLGGLAAALALRVRRRDGAADLRRAIEGDPPAPPPLPAAQQPAAQQPTSLLDELEKELER
jgi:hypothetical protein